MRTLSGTCVILIFSTSLCNYSIAVWPKNRELFSGRESLVSALEQYLDLVGPESSINPRWSTVLRSLIRVNAIHTLPVLDAMMQTDRAHFCCLDRKCDPYDADYPWPIECGATVSEAWLHAVCLEEVQSKLVSGATALDVGTGSG